VKYLVKDFGVDINQAIHDGSSSLYVAAQNGHGAVVKCFVKELSADVNQAMVDDGRTPLFLAARSGHLAVVKCLVKELGADVNKAANEGSTPLMTASAFKDTEVVVWLSKHGADAQALHHESGTATDISRGTGASAEQTAYLVARTNCANPGCTGAGLKKCAGCLNVFFCGPACIRAHWPARKVECKRIAAAAASKEK
jgi:ankyrin repeat protein